MEALRNEITLGLVTVYLCACIAIGFWAMRQTRSSRDFFVAGRQLGTWVTSIAVFSTTLSGFGFVGGPGMVYSMGITSVWLIVTSVTGYVLTFVLLAKRLRLLSEARDCVSLPDVVAARYDSATTGGLVALAIVLGVLGYLATQILAMATVLQDVLGASFAPEGGSVSLEACTALTCGVLILYCTTGGILASVYTDVMQGAMMVVAAVLVCLAANAAMQGGFPAIGAALVADDPEAIGPWGSLGMLGCLSFFSLYMLGTAGQPHVVTKLMMTRHVGDAKQILPLSLAGYTLSALLWVSVGLVMRALVVTGGHEPLASSDMAAPVFLQRYAHPLLAGLVFAGLLAAIMSTADAFLNIGAAALVHDLPKAFRGRPAANELRAARVASVVLTLVGAGFALYSHHVNARLIGFLGIFGSATFAAALVPVVAIGLNWRRATPLAASSAVAASLVINVGIEVLGVRLPFGIHGGIVAMLVSLSLFFGISLAQRPPRLAPDVEAVFDV
jgi:Na+/proline symporter